jgi:hypothetical protein
MLLLLIDLISSNVQGSAIGCFLSSARSIAEADEVVALTKGALLAATVAGIASVCIAGELAAARKDVQGPVSLPFGLPKHGSLLAKGNFQICFDRRVGQAGC